MLGAIIGDIIGSVYEGFSSIKTKDFPLFCDRCHFTDDTVLTIAVADTILHNGDYVERFKWYYQRYPKAGYGKGFRAWALLPSSQPYHSFGNGSAMRVSPVAFAFNDLETVLNEAKRSAEVTHNHPEGIKGAQAVASAVFLARTTQDKTLIKSYIQTNFGYNLEETLDEIRPNYHFNSSCQGSVPQAIIAFLESTDFEDAIRNAISLGGDSDTIACIAGGIADAFYGNIPNKIVQQALVCLSEPQYVIFEEFMSKFVHR
jgi:ADP-ribosylglycohydrolase